jgi:hypothetical protein
MESLEEVVAQMVAPGPVRRYRQWAQVAGRPKLPYKWYVMRVHGTWYALPACVFFLSLSVNGDYILVAKSFTHFCIPM